MIPPTWSFVLCAMWPWDIITKGESKN